MTSVAKEKKRLRGYCPQCKALCPVIAEVENGVFTRVLPDRDHPNACPLCPKGIAGPEMVYSPQRLKVPMRRTRPKGDPDPGWEKISWDEALDIISRKMEGIKEDFGAEAVAFYRSSNGGSSSKDWVVWSQRLAHAFGSPNSIFTTHICNWHKDSASAYTYGVGIPEAEFAKSACILIWGHNPHNTWPTHVRDITRGMKAGAKLIVVDPRRTQLAEKADLWLQVRPGTDMALALSMISVMISEKLYDRPFVLDWTNGPLLVRGDNGKLLRSEDISGNAGPEGLALWDEKSRSPGFFDPRSVSFEAGVSPALEGTTTVRLAGGKTLQCKTAFQHLLELAEKYPPEIAQKITGVPESGIREAARLFATVKPASYYTYNGIEQNRSALQTNRSICILYALTGSFDREGGNRILPSLPLKPIAGRELMTPEIEGKRLGARERPLGPPGNSQRLKRIKAVTAGDVYRAILDSSPYPIKGLIAFGGNLITGNPDSLLGREALKKLDFFVQTELFMTPPALLADIVLPAASFWEAWHVRAGFEHTPEANGHVQLREAVVPPRHESKPDTEIIFELAKRLGLAELFWGGDPEAAFNEQLGPLGISVGDLRARPGGITFELPRAEKTYAVKDPVTGVPAGFNTPCKRMEIYSQLLKDFDYDPLPIYKEQTTGCDFHRVSPAEYPLTLTNFKVLEYCHGWGRCLPSLRRRVPEPYLEIHPETAKALDIKGGETVALETPYGAISMAARITELLAPGVVATQHGWWQDCPELGLPGYDPYSREGRNVNLLYSDQCSDPISGSILMKGCPCRIRKLRVPSLDAPADEAMMK
ncbi:MAG: molybdopterin-dependent oxidoreductase [Pseudomonadota bacterium]